MTKTLAAAPIFQGEAQAFDQLLNSLRAAYNQGGLADVFELQRRLAAELAEAVPAPDTGADEPAWRVLAARELSDKLLPRYDAAMAAFAAANPA